LNVTLLMGEPGEEFPEPDPPTVEMALAAAPELPPEVDESLLDDRTGILDLTDPNSDISRFEIDPSELDQELSDPDHVPSATPGEELTAPEPPPMRLRLRADYHGQLVKMSLNQKGFATGYWGGLRGYIIGILGDDRGANSIQASSEIVLDFDDNLQYRHVINAITACSGYVDEDGQIVSLVQKYKIVWPANMDSLRPSLAEQEKWEKRAGSDLPGSRVGRPDERVKLPESQLARTPEAPYDEPILLQLDVEGNVIVYDDVFPMEAMPEVMFRQRENLLRLGLSASDGTIIIRGHEDCPAGKIRQLIGICAAQQFERFVLRTRLTPPQ
jgi:hypothetical protein